MTDNDPTGVDKELMNGLADDALSIVRIDLLIVALLASFLPLGSQLGSGEYLRQVGNSIYTIVGFQFLLGSMLAAVYLYIRARVIATWSVYKDSGVLSDEKLVTYALGASALGSVLSVVLLLAGTLDGLGEGGVPIVQVSALFFPVILIIILFDLLVLPELLSKLRQRIGEWLASW